jgi:hypothetical protein
MAETFMKWEWRNTARKKTNNCGTRISRIQARAQPRGLP